MKDKSIQKQLLEEIASVGQDDGVEALTEEKISEICKKYNFSEAEFIGLETEIFSAGNVTSLSDNEETLENVAGGKLDIKKSTATLLAALNVASPFASSAFATGTKEGSPEIDTVKTHTQTPTDINSKKHNNSSKERIAKMYENATKYVQEKFGLTREKAKSIVSSDYISQKYQSAIKYVQENFGLSRGQAESVIAAMGVTESLATTLCLHKVYKALTPKKPEDDNNIASTKNVEMQTLDHSIDEDKKQILKDCKVKDIFGTEPMFVFKINDAERERIISKSAPATVDNDDSLYVIIKSMVNNNQNIEIVREIDKRLPCHFVLSKEEAKKLFDTEITVEAKITPAVAIELAHLMKEKKEEEVKEEEVKEEEKKEEVKVEEEEEVEEEVKVEEEEAEEEGDDDDNMKEENSANPSKKDDNFGRSRLSREKFLKLLKKNIVYDIKPNRSVAFGIEGKNLEIALPLTDTNYKENIKIQQKSDSSSLSDCDLYVTQKEAKRIFNVKIIKKDAEIDKLTAQFVAEFIKAHAEELNKASCDSEEESVTGSSSESDSEEEEDGSSESDSEDDSSTSGKPRPAAEGVGNDDDLFGNDDDGKKRNP